MFDDMWERDRLRKEAREAADQAAIAARQSEQTAVLEQQITAAKDARFVRVELVLSAALLLTAAYCCLLLLTAAAFAAAGCCC